MTHKDGLPVDASQPMRMAKQHLHISLNPLIRGETVSQMSTILQEAIGTKVTVSKSSKGKPSGSDPSYPEERHLTGWYLPQPYSCKLLSKFSFWTSSFPGPSSLPPQNHPLLATCTEMETPASHISNSPGTIGSPTCYDSCSLRTTAPHFCFHPQYANCSQ